MCPGHSFPALLELKPQACTHTWLTKSPKGMRFITPIRHTAGVSYEDLSLGWSRCWDTGKPYELLMPWHQSCIFILCSRQPRFYSFDLHIFLSRVNCLSGYVNNTTQMTWVSLLHFLPPCRSNIQPSWKHCEGLHVIFNFLMLAGTRTVSAGSLRRKNRYCQILP